ncbi:MAG: hypothetical protein J6Y82_10155 [Bacteroidales bacterium]|nr:hypothetical protein [Bacteroidales bacterium]
MKIFTKSLAVLSFCSTMATAQPSEILDNPYGICAHLTRWTDYNLRDKELELIKSIGIGNVRADFDATTLMKNNTFLTQIFDDVVASCEKQGITLLPILSRSVSKYAWEDSVTYNTYINFVLDRYSDRIKRWEYMNEPDLISSQLSYKDLASKYISTMPKAHRAINKKGGKMLMGGLAAVHSGFWDQMLIENSMNNVDIMNFHYYTNYETPEYARNAFYKLITDPVSKYKYKHPRWLTETGYHTEGNKMSSNAFWNEIVPKCLSDLNIKKEAAIGIICDNDLELYGIRENETEFLIDGGYGNIKYLTLNELDNLDPQTVPVLIPTRDEAFPSSKINALEDYLRKGGTIILSYGVPLYYDKVSKSEIKQVGDKYLRRFHMSALFWWLDNAKKLGAPEIPDRFELMEGLSDDYKWNYSKTYSARYMTADNLKQGDSLVQVVKAGNDKFMGCVAGIYKLRSDLKGNIIFQTRLDRTGNVTETLQAKRLTRSILLAFSQGMDKVFIYNFKSFENDKNSSEDHFGIVHADLSPKPAFNAYATLIKMLPDKSVRPTMSQNKGLYNCVWRQPNGKKVEAYWTSIGDRKVKLKRRKVKAIYDYMGNEINKSSEITATNGVTFVLYK